MNTEKELRKAWEAGFKLAVDYADNHIHCVGEQADRQWNAYFAELSKQPDHATRYGHCSGCKTGGTHYMGTVEHPEDPAPVLVAFSERDIGRAILDMIKNGDLDTCEGYSWNVGARCGLSYANTRAVSVDQWVEVVTNVLDGMDNSTSFIYVDDLREAFTKLVTTNEHGKI
jgi:hypothetical protein